MFVEAIVTYLHVQQVILGIFKKFAFLSLFSAFFTGLRLLWLPHTLKRYLLFLPGLPVWRDGSNLVFLLRRRRYRYALKAVDKLPKNRCPV